MSLAKPPRLGHPPLYIPFYAVSGRVKDLRGLQRLNPNVVTASWIAGLALCGLTLYLNMIWLSFLLVNFCVFLDCLDGDLARNQNKTSLSGSLFEQFGHWIGNMSVVAGAGMGFFSLYPTASSSLLLAALCLSHANYLATVTRIERFEFSAKHPILTRQLLFRIVKFNYVLMPIELPFITILLIFGLNAYILWSFVFFNLCVSLTIFILQFRLYLFAERSAQKHNLITEFPNAALEEGERFITKFETDTHVMTPGYSKLPAAVLFLSRVGPLHYSDEQMLEAGSSINKDLRAIFQTAGLVVTVPASPNIVIEAIMCSTLERGDNVIIINSGPDSKFWMDIAEVYGIKINEFKVPYGQPINISRLSQAIQTTEKPKAVFAVLTESYCGGVNDIASIGQLLSTYGNICFVVDVSLGLGADNFKMDQWGVDIAVGISSYGLMALPGLTLLAVSERVREQLSGHPSTKLRRYLDSDYSSNVGFPTQVALALEASTKMILAEGIDRFISHHVEVASGFRRGCEEVLGYQLVAKHPSNAVTSALLPTDIKSKDLVRVLKSEYSIHVAANRLPNGQETICIGHAGWVFRDDIYKTIESIALSNIKLRATN